MNYYNQIINTQSYKIWSGFMFEIVLINNIELFLDYRGLSGIFKNIGYWHYIAKNDDEKGAQIDIVVEYQNNIYDIIECKYYDNEIILSKDDVDNINNKIEKFKQYGIRVKNRYDLKFNFITTYGCKINSAYNNLNIANDITLDILLGD